MSILSTGVPFSTTEAALLASGYRPGAPMRISEESQLIDAEACDEATCGHCGRDRLAYVPYSRDESYRVVALGTHCQTGEEV